MTPLVYAKPCLNSALCSPLDTHPRLLQPPPPRRPVEIKKSIPTRRPPAPLSPTCPGSWR
jgi:hypothetical protein